MIPQLLSPGASVTPPNAPTAHARHDPGDGPGDRGEPARFTLHDAADGAAPATMDAAPQAGLAQPQADTPRIGSLPVRSDQQAGWGGAGPEADEAWHGTGQKAAGGPQSVATPADGLCGGTPERAALFPTGPTSQTAGPGDTGIPAEHGSARQGMPPVSGAATHAAMAPDLASPTNALRPPTAELTAQATAQAARQGSPRGHRSQEPPATPHPAAVPMQQAGPLEIPERAESAITAPPTDIAGASPDKGTEAGLLARDADPARVDASRTDSLRAEAPRTDVARAVGNQLVEAVRHGPNGTTEVALNPEELGRVRLGLSTQDGVLHVSIMAERPETQDMLRRHIASLQTDFRALGYTDVAFDFGPGGDQPQRPSAPAPIPASDPDARDPTAMTSDEAKSLPTHPSPIGAAVTRLDRRV